MIVWCVAIGVLALGHPLPDQHVERAVQVTVYPSRIEIHYFLGVNDNTVADWLRQFAGSEELPDAADAAFVEFSQRIFPQLAKQIAVTIEGKRHTVRLKEHARVYKHHVQLECVYQVPVEPDESPRALTIVDGNFRSAPGAHRMAIKGREGAFVLDATAPPILARAERIPWSEMTKEQKYSATRVEGSLVIPPPREF
jgi:hypothetical protein